MAKRFVFRLETVRRVRELREGEAQRALAAHQAKIAQLEQQNAQAQHEIADHQRQLADQQSYTRVDPRELAAGRGYIAHLRTAILIREQQIAEMATELDRLRDVWRGARQQLEIINKLRERRIGAHTKLVQKAEQRDMDEVAQRLHVMSKTI